ISCAMLATSQVNCVYAIVQCTALLLQVSGVLALPNQHAVHARVQQLQPAQCDLVISRALASLKDFASLGGRHVRNEGTLVALKGKVPQDEIEALHQRGDWRVEDIQALQVPRLDAHRCLIGVRRSQGTLWTPLRPVLAGPAYSAVPTRKAG